MRVFHLSACVAVLVEALHSLLGAVVLPSDVRCWTELGIKELTPEDGEENSETRGGEDKDACLEPRQRQRTEGGV